MPKSVSVKELIETIACSCPAYDTKLEELQTHLKCNACNSEYPIKVENSVPKIHCISTEFDSGLLKDSLSKFNQRHWTPWRIENQKFIRENILEAQDLVIDIGAGPGVFNDLYKSERLLTIDFTNFPQTNLIADLTNSLPLKRNLTNLVILSNTLEHIPESEKLLHSVNQVLNMYGQVIVTVPFLLDVHQAPFDFFRFTPFSLVNLAEKTGFDVTKITASGDIGTFKTLSKHFFQFRIGKGSKMSRLLWQLQKMVIWACELSLKDERRMEYCGGYMLVLTKTRNLY